MESNAIKKWWHLSHATEKSDFSPASLFCCCRTVTAQSSWKRTHSKPWILAQLPRACVFALDCRCLIACFFRCLYSTILAPYEWVSSSGMWNVIRRWGNKHIWNKQAYRSITSNSSTPPEGINFDFCMIINWTGKVEASGQCSWVHLIRLQCTN